MNKNRRSHNLIVQARHAVESITLKAKRRKHEGLDARRTGRGNKTSSRIDGFYIRVLILTIQHAMFVCQ